MHKDCVIIFQFFVFVQFSFFLTTVTHAISITDYSLFCSNSARKCLILPAECQPQKSLILLEILPAEFIQAQSLRIRKTIDILNIQRVEFKDVAFLTYNFAEIMLYYLLPQNIHCVLNQAQQSYYKDYFSEKVCLNFALMLLWPMKTLLLI